MSDITISYKGSSIATMDATGSKTLLTEGKYCEDDITVDYVKPSGGGGGSHNLPSGYTEYEYIETSGTQHINTGYVPINDSVITYTFQRTVSGQLYNGVEFGSHINPKCIASGRYFGWGSVTDKTGDYDPDYIFGPMTINVKSSGCYNLVGQNAVNFGTPTWTSGSNALYIAARNNAGTAQRNAKEKIYYFCAYENSTKMIELIPAMRTSDSVLGMYDTVGNTFLTNAGTGTFTGGAFS